jgi:hypothetical protein
VEWRSTAEFRALTRLELYVGVRNDAASVDGSSRVYAPALHGPRNFAPVPGETVVSSYSHSGRTYARMKDNYYRDPTGLLRIPLQPWDAFAGKAVVMLPLAAFEADYLAPGDRFFVRAFAETAPKNAAGCATSFPARQQGACIRHYAFTNPIWAITKRPLPGTCQPSARAFDRDGDGLPDGCDPCPYTAARSCFAAPSSPASGKPPVIARPRR